MVLAKRQRPYVPVWNYAKVPRVSLPPAENARLLSVYMRPWTLNPSDATTQTPLLSRLNVVSSTPQHSVAKVTVASKDDAENAGSAQSDPPNSSGERADAAKADQYVGGAPCVQKRRRLSSKTRGAMTASMSQEERSYAKSWAQYIHGNVVSKTNQRYITNLLTATAARVVEEPGDSSEDSDDFNYDHIGRPAGNMDLIQRTLDGISCRSNDNGVEAIGRYATVIELGRNVWQSPPLTAAEAAPAKEQFFDDGSFPPVAEVLKAAQEAVKNEDERPTPFNGRTRPLAQYTQTDLAQRFNDWFKKIATEGETPNKEQLAVLKVRSSAPPLRVVLFVLPRTRGGSRGPKAPRALPVAPLMKKL